MVLNWWRRRRDERRITKVKPGDGAALKPYRLWQVFTRSLFYLRRELPGGRAHVYAYDVDYFSFDGLVHEYTDSVRTASATSPALFVVPGGVVEIRVGTVGLSRIHFVPDAPAGEAATEHPDEAVTVATAGSTGAAATEARPLQPHRNSGEGLRARFDHRYPKASRWIGGIAVVILLAGLVLAVPQLLEMITQFDWVAVTFGSFTSPISLPAWANTSIFVIGVLAALERALTLRNHWLIDLDTWWIG